MNKEELLKNTSIFNDKDIFEKLDKNKELRDWFLVELNACLQRSESIVANLKDKKELRCYKNAVTSLEVENQKYKEVIYKLKDKTKENIKNAKYEITTLTIGDKAYYQYIEKMLNNYVDILKGVDND